MELSSSIGDLIYFSISDRGHPLHSFTAGGDGDGDGDLETLASLCLEKAPPFHSHYFHTSGDRTFGFLIDGPLVFFSISHRSFSKIKILRLLHQIKNRYKKTGKGVNFDQELVLIIRRAVNCEKDSSQNGFESGEAPLLGRSGSGVRIEMMEEEEEESNDGDAIVTKQQKSLGYSSSRRQQLGQKLWWRQVKIVVAADVFLSLVLFGIWLAVCRGFQCLS